MATKSWAATLPPKISTRLRGCAASTLRCAHTSEALGRSFAAASRRHRGTAKTRPRATPITTMAITMSQTSFESLLEPLLVGDELKWRLPYARGRAMRKRAPLTIQLAVLATRVRFFQQEGYDATQPHLAPVMVLHDLVTLTRTAMRAHPPTRVPTTRARLTQLTRRGSMSLGTSTPAAAAPWSRKPVRMAFLPRRAFDATGASAARCRNGNASTRASDGTIRAAAAMVRSGPATTARAARVAAMSLLSWSALATVDAARKSTIPVEPSSSTTMVSVDREPWAMPVSRSAITWRKTSSSTPSSNGSTWSATEPWPPGSERLPPSATSPGAAAPGDAPSGVPGGPVGSTYGGKED